MVTIEKTALQGKGLIYHSQQRLFGSREIIGFGSPAWHVKEIDRKLANDLIVKNHYSRKFFGLSYIHLGVFINGRLSGVLQYGYALNPVSCGGIVEGTNKNQYLELNRMWLHERAERNSESKAISYSFKYIRAKFTPVKWVQSFADERCGRFGIVYQACSFGFYGEHTGVFWEWENEVFHYIQMSISKDNRRYSPKVKRLQDNKHNAKKLTLRQFRYIKFLDGRWKKKCKLKELPYLKHYNGD